MHLQTRLAQLGTGRDPATGAISMPIHQSATFEHPALGQSTGFDYSRSSNPTRLALEEGLASLEGADGGFAFASGMAAITAVLTYFKSGDHFVVTEDAYGGTYRIFNQIFSKFGLTATFVDTSDLKAVASAIQGNTVAIFFESPTNPMLKVADTQRIIDLAKAHGLLSIVDNTFLTPVYQQPLQMGADIVIHSASKYLSGHNDVIAGAVMTKGAELTEAMAYIQKSTGAILGPQDSWLLMRGLKTLSLRIKHQCESAYRIAQWLKGHPMVASLNYPGIERHQPYGAMISFTLQSPEACATVLQALQIIRFAESLGGTESLITYPCTQTHAEMPIEYRNRLGITDCLLRFSVGIEDAQDLISDLAQALKKLDSTDYVYSDFDRLIDRRPFYSTKWREMDVNFGTNDLTPFWVADMDFEVAPCIKQAIDNMAGHGIYGYMYRSPSYFNAIVSWYKQRHQWHLQPEQLIFSPGVIASLSLLIDGLTTIGDGIVIQEPVYFPFKQKIVERQRRPIINDLHCDDRGCYHMDFQALESIFVTHRPKLLILCNPHNPVGKVWEKDVLITLGNLCIKYDVRIISDEIHCDLVMPPFKHIPIASLSDAIASITTTLAAPSKTFNIAGLQTSFVICTNPEDSAILQDGLQRLDIKRNNSFSLVATEAAFTGGGPWLDQLIRYIQNNEQLVREYCEKHLPKVRISPLEATYLLWMKVDHYIGDDDLLQEQLVKAGLAVNKGIGFGQGGQGHIRINLACPKSMLEQALPQLLKALTVQ